jgi:hypothetical protein
MKRGKLGPAVVLASAAMLLTQIGCAKKAKAPKKAAPAAHLSGYYTRMPWTAGTRATAVSMAAAGTVLPMADYSFTASKDGQQYSGVLAGASPFATPLSSSTIGAVIVPLKIDIGSATFDASKADPCDASVSGVTRLRQSPLVNDVPSLTFNGINVGNAQFINGFRRAEFWTTIQGSAAYQNELNFTFASSVELAASVVGTNGNTQGSGCGQIGILSIDWLDGYLQNTLLPQLTSAGVVSPTSVVFFVVKNVVESQNNPPSTASCCILGYHSATGTVVQTYGVFDWDTSGSFGSSVAAVSIASHEIGEFMDDPLANNATPAWGNVGQVSGCQNNWEVGDPLSGTLMPAILMNGTSYQPQELAFSSWFFNAAGSASSGAGGKFSANGTFQGPSKACPPGGTN